MVAAAAVVVDTFKMELDMPIPGFELVKPWMPAVNVGGDSSAQTTALEAVVKKEVSTRRQSGYATRRRSLLQLLDERRLRASIPSTAHKGLRMLCAEEALGGLQIDCPVDIAAGEFACARISNVRCKCLSFN